MRIQPETWLGDEEEEEEEEGKKKNNNDDDDDDDDDDDVIRSGNKSGSKSDRAWVLFATENDLSKTQSGVVS